MLNITNETQLRMVIVQELKKALQIAAQNIHDELWDNIFSRIYSKSESEFYERTQEFLDSVIHPIVKVNGFDVEVTIGMDSSRMHPRQGDSGMFNQHMDIYGNDSWHGKSIPESLLSWWDTGTTNSRLPELDKTDYWFDVMGDRGYKDNPDYKNAQKIFDEAIVRELSKIGIVSRY